MVINSISQKPSDNAGGNICSECTKKDGKIAKLYEALKDLILQIQVGRESFDLKQSLEALALVEGK